MAWKIPNIWQDGECIILGGGSSVPQQLGVPDELIHSVSTGVKKAEKFSPYFQPIKSKHIIGINMAFRLGTWVDMMFFGDASFFKKNKQEILAWQNLRITCATFDKVVGIKRVKRSKQKYGITGIRDEVCWNANSGAAAINVAVHLGVKRIILLGFDMQSVENQTHWHQYYAPKDLKKMKDTYKKHLAGFPEIARYCKSKNIEVLNASPNSALQVFTKVQLKDVI